MGADVSEHARSLTASRITNLTSIFSKYTRRNVTAKHVQSLLSLSFKELYRREQLQLKLIGPIFIYARPQLLLYLRACVDHKLARTILLIPLLRSHDKNADYLYHVVEMCQHFPSYQNKQRSISTIRKFLESVHYTLPIRITLKAQPSYPVTQVRKWATKQIKDAGTGRPHWKAYVIARIQVIDMPMQSWNQRLVNVQKACKGHVWPQATTPPGLTLPEKPTLKLQHLVPEQQSLPPDLTRLPANSKSRSRSKVTCVRKNNRSAATHFSLQLASTPT